MKSKGAIVSEEIKTNGTKRQCTEDIPQNKKKKTVQIFEEEKKDKKNTVDNDTEEISNPKKEQTGTDDKLYKGNTIENSSSTALGQKQLFVKSFSVLKDNVCEQTLKAIQDMGFTNMTEIQAKSIPHLLKGRDLVGSAKTGSGKTLAFLIPVIELIYKLKVSPSHGTGCIIISPTRELSIQTFKVLTQLMRNHHHTYGLLIGGANKKTEARNLAKGMNIIVATPGRLLDHLQNEPHFVYKNLKCLVIDETDKLMDIGFEKQMRQIIDILPKHRQSILFSATQTKKVTMLTKLVVKKNFIYVGIDDDKEKATVKNLQQGYLVCPSEMRFQFLFTFLKKYRKKKVMVFFNSCLSVKYHHKVFNYIHLPVMCIYGKQKQSRRTNTFLQFCNAESGTLFCTDVAARGLDIPNVDWIVQYDPPDDAKEYIHRVGRTARAGTKGSALLLLRPEEFDMIHYLRYARVPLSEYAVVVNKMYDIQSVLEELISKDANWHSLAKKAFKAYLKSYNCHRLNDVFNIVNLDLTATAKSFGFTASPINWNLKVKKK